MVLQRLKQLIGKVMKDHPIDLDAVTNETTLGGDLGFSSIMMLMTAIAMEQEFGIEITQMDSNSFVTVGDVCGFIEKKLKEK
jgi:acyl carrier protein